MRKALAAATLLLASTGAVLAAAPRPIGFRVLERRDTARPSKDHPEGRPIQISVWYPAKSDALPRASMTFGDYVALAASETSPARPAAAAKTLEGYRGFLAHAGVPAAEADAWLATKMDAVRDATPAAGRMPLVLVAQGNGDSAADQAFLSERLAERGFVVATTPSQANIDGRMKTELDIPDQAEAQAADLAFASRQLRSLGNVARGRSGIVGHSFGARSALLVAMTDRDVAAFVSLDGGIGSKQGIGVFETSKGFDRLRMKAPLLHVYEEGDPAMPVSFWLIQSLPDEQWLVRADAMRHVHFSSTGILAQRVAQVGAATSATPQTGAAWEAVTDATESFLEHFLGDTPERWTPPSSPLLHSEYVPRR